MSNLSKESVLLLSKLCRIQLTEKELESLYGDLKRVLDYIDLLREVDVSDLSPYSHIDSQNVSSLREDEVGEVLKREHFLANAPDQVGGMVRVPPVIRAS